MGVIGPHQRMSHATMVHVEIKKVDGYLVGADPFELVKPIGNKIPPNVPFDPGCFGSEAKFEHKFFRTGRVRYNNESLEEEDIWLQSF